MLTIGSVLDEQFQVSQSPERIAVGEAFAVTDSNGAAHTAVIASTGVEGWAVSLADNEVRAPAAAAQGLAHLVFAERVVAIEGGAAAEILPRAGFDEVEQYATGLSVQQSPGRVVGMLAARFAAIAEDLAVLHARGEVHGAIDAHALLVDTQHAARIVLALFSRAKLVQPPPATPPDAACDVRALADAFHALVTASRAPIDPVLAADVQALAAPNADGTPRTIASLTEALRALASRLGVAPTAAPAFGQPAASAPAFSSGAPPFTSNTSTDGAYRPPPAANDPFAGRAPGVHLPVRPDDGGGFRMGGRAIGLVLGVVIAVIRIAARSSSHSYSSYSGNNYYDNRYDRYSHPTDPIEDRTRCEGEPTSPVATASIPGSGEVRGFAAACDEQMIRTAVLRGSDLYLASRSGIPDAEWSQPSTADRIATDVDDVSSSAPSESGASFVAFDSMHGSVLGVAPLAETSRATTMPLVGETIDTRPYALGQTEHFTYVAVHTIPTGSTRGTLLLARIGNPSAAGEDDGIDTAQPVAFTLFDLGRYTPKSVIADEESPRLLVSEGDLTRPSALRTLTLDLGVFDAVNVPVRARGHQRVPAHGVTMTAPIATSSLVLLAAPAGSAVGDTFLVASASASPASETCNGSIHDGFCFEVRDARLAYFPREGEPSLGPVLDASAIPIAVWSGTDGIEALVGASRSGSTALTRFRIGAEHQVARSGSFFAPTGIPRIDGFTQLGCGGHAWMVFAGDGVAETVQVAAVPSSCTDIGSPRERLTGATTPSVDSTAEPTDTPTR